MKTIINLILYPNNFYKRVSEGELKINILILFIINVFISLWWEYKIGIPLGNYELYFFDNTLLDSIMSVTLNILVLAALSGALYIFTLKSALKMRFEKSYLLVISLASINTLAVAVHIISYYVFSWLINVQILLVASLSIQSIYFFIGIKRIFGYSNLRTTLTQVSCFLLIGVVTLIRSHAGSAVIKPSSNLSYNSKADLDRNKSHSVTMEKRLLKSVDRLRLRDKSHVFIESSVTWRIADQILFDKSIVNTEQAEIRIRDIYTAIMLKNLLVFLYTENGDLDIVGNKIITKIINECNRSKLRKEFGIEIITLEILNVQGNMEDVVPRKN